MHNSETIANEKEEFKEAGFNDVLMKPLNFDKLVLVVKSLTEK